MKSPLLAALSVPVMTCTALAQVPIIDRNQLDPKSEDVRNSGDTEDAAEHVVKLSNGLVCNVLRRGGSPARTFNGSLPQAPPAGSSYGGLGLDPGTGPLARGPAIVQMETVQAIGALLSVAAGQLPLNTDTFTATANAAGGDVLFHDAWDRNAAARSQAAQAWNQAMASSIGMAAVLNAREQATIATVSAIIEMLTYSPADSNPFAPGSPARSGAEKRGQVGSTISEDASAHSPALKVERLRREPQ